MSMSNRVVANCPKCGYKGSMQVREIVSIFGSLDINDPDSLAKELNEEQLQEFYDAVKEGEFVCGDTIMWDEKRTKGCGHCFNPLIDNNKDKRIELARKLFGPRSD